MKKFPLLFLLYKLHNPPTPANINKGGRREAERERRGEREKGGGEKRRKGARKEERGRREKEREEEEQVSQYSDLNKKQNQKIGPPAATVILLLRFLCCSLHFLNS